MKCPGLDPRARWGDLPNAGARSSHVDDRGTHARSSQFHIADRTTDELLGAVHAYYDEEDSAEYIEVSRMPGVRPTFDGIALLETEPARAVAAVARHAQFDGEDPELGYSYVFKPLDLSLWRPVDDDSEPEGRTFMTVGAGRAGYYA